VGQEVDRTRFTAQEFEDARERAGAEAALFGRLARAGGLSSHGFVIGFELEAWLVDHGLVPAPINEAYLAALADPLVVPELSRFNVELNGTPLPLGADAAALVLIGILPRSANRTWCSRTSRRCAATLRSTSRS
jgi:hypothetical protein